MNHVPANPVESKYYESISQRENVQKNVASQSETDTTKIVLAVVVGILTFPIWFGILAGIFGILIGILGALLGVTVGLAAAGVGMVIAAFLSSAASGGVMLAGIGLILLAVSILFFILLVLFCGKLLPWMIKGSAELIRKLFGRKECVA